MGTTDHIYHRVVLITDAAIVMQMKINITSACTRCLYSFNIFIYNNYNFSLARGFGVLGSIAESQTRCAVVELIYRHLLRRMYD